MTSKQYNQLVNHGSADFRALQTKVAEKKHGKLPDVLLLGMNKTEARYAQHLWLLRHAGEISDYTWCGKDRSQSLPIGRRRCYTPDFKVITATGETEIHEVKGYLRDGGSIRFDLAAEQHPQYVFRMFRYVRHEWVQIRVWNETN